MQLRCTYCQTMFAVSRDETLAALEHMAEHSQKYYDAHCPNCRRANRVERFKLELSYPDWQAAIKTMDKNATAEAVKEAAAPAIATSSTKGTSSPRSTRRVKGKPAAASPKTSVKAKKPVAGEKTTSKVKAAAKSEVKSSAKGKPAPSVKKPVEKKPAPASTKGKPAAKATKPAAAVKSTKGKPPAPGKKK